MAYLFDANVFIQAKNLHYDFDVCPAFWDWVEREHSSGDIFSVEKVGTELQAIEDELSARASVWGSAFFLPPDARMLPALGAVSTWATGQDYEQVAVNEFLAGADYYLVAHALAHGHVVVTHERFAATTKKIKIPNACIGLGVKCMSPFEVLKVKRARFVLGATSGGKVQ